MNSEKDKNGNPLPKKIKPIVHVYTGDGKGKTTASVGLAVRAKSRGLRVLFSQFFKDTTGGELELLESLSITVKRYREVKSPLFHPQIDLETLKKAVREALNEITNLSYEFDLIIIDEFNCLLKEGILETEEAIEFLQRLPEGRDVVLTGRGAPQELIQLADYVTEMTPLKHPYEKGLSARKGIEY